MNNLLDITSKKSKNKKFQDEPLKSDNFVSDDTFVQAIAPVIRFMQCFGLLPVHNCLSSDLNATTFKWKSIPTIITLFCGSLSLIQFVPHICILFNKVNVGINELNTFIFNLIAIGVYLSFLRIAMNWNSLMTQWCDIERTFLRSPYKQQKFTLKLKLRVFSVIYFALGLAHDFLLLARRVHSASILINVCHFEPNYAKYTFKIVEPFTYAFTGYNHFIGLIIYYLNLSMMVGMISANLVSVLISLAIAERFKQFNEHLVSASYQHVTGSFWTECRMHHQKLMQLVNLANKYFGPIILLVCCFDIYFVSMQIFRITKINLQFAIDKIFFAYSLFFLTSSLWLTFSSAAHVNSLSKKSMPMLSTIPKGSWNLEATRFLLQLQEERVALSGCNLFAIANDSILRLTATLTTYELMLFDKFTQWRPDVSEICALLRDN